MGTLHEINSETSTVALENVKSYGTEGRKQNPAEEIPGSDQNYEYIVFRGSDVKELTIVEAPKEKPQPAAVPNDPAILGVRMTQQSEDEWCFMMKHTGCKSLLFVRERKTLWTLSVAFLLIDTPHTLTRELA